jgi:drug/metabolite transporter (DMT)-like permease
MIAPSGKKIKMVYKKNQALHCLFNKFAINPWWNPVCTLSGIKGTPKRLGAGPTFLCFTRLTSTFRSCSTCSMIKWVTMPFRNKILPYLALGGAVLSFCFSAFFVRWANVPPAVMGFYRLGIASAIMTPFFLRRAVLMHDGVSRLVQDKGILLFPILAGLASAMNQFIWNYSLKFTSAANASLLGNTSPFWVALTAWLIFHERARGLFWLGLGLTMAGAAAVLSIDFLRHPTLGWGDLLAFSSATFSAAFYIFSQRSRQRWDSLSHVWLAGLASTLIMLVLCLITRSPLFGYTRRAYLVIVGAAIFVQLTGYLALGYALGHIPASVASPTMLGQAVLTALLAIPILGEPLHPVQWIGGVVVLAGIYLVIRSRETAPEGMGAD